MQFRPAKRALQFGRKQAVGSLPGPKGDTLTVSSRARNMQNKPTEPAPTREKISTEPTMGVDSRANSARMESPCFARLAGLQPNRLRERVRTGAYRRPDFPVNGKNLWTPGNLTGSVVVESEA